ncbi:MAG: transposase [Lentisphaeria bacterium]|jgi:transposase
MTAQILCMTKDTIDINKTILEVEALLAGSDDMPPALEASINMPLLVVKLLADRSGLNRKNSSKPPSSDPNSEKNGRSKSKKPRGGQKGHRCHNLEPINHTDKITAINIDRRTFPRGDYIACEYEKGKYLIVAFLVK